MTQPCEAPKTVQKGLDLFNQRQFYEAHEYFEAAWRQTEDPIRELYRALLHLAGGFYRLTQNRPGAAVKFFTHAQSWIHPFPDHCQGINTGEIKTRIKTVLSALARDEPSKKILEENFMAIDYKPMHVLITGFEPFGESPINPSQELVHAFPDVICKAIRIDKAILPVDKEQGPAALLQTIHQTQPDAVLSFGQATGRSVIALERVALNLMDFRIADNAGEMVRDQPVVEGGPAAYFTGLPVRRMQQNLIDNGIPCALSLSAGTYLCNQVFYTMRHEIATNNLPIRAGFIHLPALPLQAAAMDGRVSSMSLQTALEALHLLIRVLTQTKTIKQTRD